MGQIIYEANGKYDMVDSWFSRTSCVMLVCGKSIEKQLISEYFKQLPSKLGIRIIRFSDFQPNPTYESVLKGVDLFRRESCDGIVAVGGGSAIDVAKCIKKYSTYPGNGFNGSWLRVHMESNNIPFLAMPTTAGTGSEATRFAVIYYNGIKQSISDISCIPSAVLMDSSVLKTLPQYQKKATMCDALCHAIESMWSVKSTAESMEYSKNAIRAILDNMDGYLSNTDRGNYEMLKASNIAGKAIDITQTTAGHAMCYKITSMFGCAHGHAAMLCNRILFSWMIENVEKCIDPRGEEYVKQALDEIANAMGCGSPKEGAMKLMLLFDTLELEIPVATKKQYEELSVSVNPDRLKNFPIQLDTEAINALYHYILR